MKPQIMKNLITYPKTVLLALMLYASQIGYANENPILVSYNEGKFVELTLNNVKPGNLLFIKDLDDIKLYNHTISTTGTFRKEFDLNTLPVGNYFIELNMDMERIIYPFEIDKRDVVFNEDDFFSVYKPMTRIKNEHVMISQLTLDMASLEVKIFRESESNTSFYDLVHSETVKNKRNINLVYKLEDYEKGKFKIVLISKGQKFIRYY